MIKKRRLSDLYVVGKEIIFDDGQGEPVTVYLRKLSINDQEEALRKANAARSRTLAVIRDQESDLHQSTRGDADDLDRDGLMNMIIATELAERVAAIEAEVASQEHWSKDDYLQGLQDAWADDMQARYLQDPEDEDAKHVFDEMQKYTEEVSDILGDAESNIRERFQEAPDADLREKVFTELIKAESNRQWIREFRRCEVFFATRESAQKPVRYFQHRGEIDDLDIKVFTMLLEGYRSLAVEPDQGKSLPPTASSSPPSETPASPETVELSGPQIARL